MREYQPLLLLLSPPNMEPPVANTVLSFPPITVDAEIVLPRSLQLF